VEHRAAVTIGVFPGEPDRGFYNNAVFERDIESHARAGAIAAMQAAYLATGIDHFAAWVHASDAALQRELERLHLTLPASP
jgi:hypothetical protein